MAQAQRNPQRELHSIPIEVLTDPIFFHKFQVHVGSTFRHFGRMNPHTTWVVQRIWTLRYSKPRGWVRSNVHDVRKLDDLLELRCDETGEVRTIRFGYASYSAIWRLA